MVKVYRAHPHASQLLPRSLPLSPAAVPRILINAAEPVPYLPPSASSIKTPIVITHPTHSRDHPSPPRSAVVFLPARSLAPAARRVFPLAQRTKLCPNDFFNKSRILHRQPHPTHPASDRIQNSVGPDRCPNAPPVVSPKPQPSNLPVASVLRAIRGRL